MRKKTLLISLVLVLTGLLIIGCSSGNTTEAEEGASNNQEAKVITVGHVLAPEHPYHKGLLKFAEIVEEKTEGTYKVEVYPSGQIGGERDMVEGMQLGTVHGGLIGGTLGLVEPKFMVTDLPFIFRDRKHAYKVLDGSIGQDLLDSLSNHKLKGLCFWENGFRQITNSKRPIKTPADMEGLKIRTPENKVQIAAIEAMGANPTPMAFPELFTALEQKVVDGQENSLSIIASSRLDEVQEYCTIINYMYQPATFVMSKKFFDGLPSDIQKIIMEAAREAQKYERQLIQEEDEKLAKELKERGMKINTIEDVSLFREKVKPVYEQFSEKIGADLIQSIIDTK
ncbi:MAG: TRAP-type transport system periplasmic protein [Clostridia bacterium]|jgi:tripartite ATP-independent transporter DctP family solute receptor|nr:dicarboxylate transporter, DctP subunit [Clostridiales bacterium]MDK2985907.1 TRAP-type transport system periplasmic protein [Clostridia bacterium]